jgi:hypothetical protein
MGPLFFILGGSAIYVLILKMTEGENVGEEENNRRREISIKNKKNKRHVKFIE